jgi:hypothetical protein
VTTSDRVGGAILTASGGVFWPLDPRPDEVELADIAHALSHLCRFTGHVRAFYSVAEHACHVHDLLELDGHDGNTCRWGLLHDASEAYIGDVARPTKMAGEGFGTAYRDVEQRLMDVIAQRYGLRPTLQPAVVKAADDRLLITERRDLMPPVAAAALQWPAAAPIARSLARPWAPDRARLEFVIRAAALDLCEMPPRGNRIRVNWQHDTEGRRTCPR